MAHVGVGVRDRDVAVDHGDRLDVELGGAQGEHDGEPVFRILDAEPQGAHRRVGVEHDADRSPMMVLAHVSPVIRRGPATPSCVGHANSTTRLRREWPQECVDGTDGHCAAAIVAATCKGTLAELQRRAYPVSCRASARIWKTHLGSTATPFRSHRDESWESSFVGMTRVLHGAVGRP